MRASRVPLGGLVLLFGLLGNAHAQTSYPMITHTSPVAVQRGKTTTVTVAGQMNFFGIYKALFEGTGLTAEELPPAPAATAPKGTARAVKVKVAADAALGVRDFRLASPLGVSSVGQLLIVDYPVIEESGVNNTPEKANPIKTPCVVCGRIEIAEDVDYYKFHAVAGQTFS